MIKRPDPPITFDWSAYGLGKDQYILAKVKTREKQMQDKEWIMRCFAVAVCPKCGGTLKFGGDDEGGQVLLECFECGEKFSKWGRQWEGNERTRQNDHCILTSYNHGTRF